MEHGCFSVSEFHRSVRETEWRPHPSSEITVCGTMAPEHTAGSAEYKEKCHQQKTSLLSLLHYSSKVLYGLH